MGNICCCNISNEQNNNEIKFKEKIKNISEQNIYYEKKDENLSNLSNEKNNIEIKIDEKVPNISDQNIHNEKKDENIKNISNKQNNIEIKIDEKVPNISDQNIHNEKKDENITNISNKQNNIEIKINEKVPSINEQNKPEGEIKENNNFPMGSEYEKELNLNFKYFNVFWYDQNKNNDFNLFKKCFENVLFYKSHDLNSIINFFKKESISEWIVITTGSKGKELIQNLEKNNCIKSFFIYCLNTKLHESWAKNIKKVGCITSNPEILCQKFIEFNNGYYIPQFNYKSKVNNIEISSIENNENLFTSNSKALKYFIELKKNFSEKYNSLCIKILHYLDNDEFDNDFKETSLLEGNSPLLVFINMIKDNKESLQSKKNYRKNLILISLYFSKFPFIYNLFTFEEVIDLTKREITLDIVMGIEINLVRLVEKIGNKILKNECILDEKDELKKIHISIIYLLLSDNKMRNNIFYSYHNSYQIINFLRDFDFCLKIIILSKFIFFYTKKFNFLDEIHFSLLISDPRYLIYLDFADKKAVNKNQFTEDEIKIVNDSLTIKDFIIIGDTKFHEKIKTIEKNIKYKSLEYLNISQISNYVKNKLQKKGRQISIYFYILIIRFDEFQENYEKFVELSMKLGITFLAILYVENKYIINVYKEILNIIIAKVLVYSPEDIINYLSQKFIFFNPLNLPEPKELSDLLNIKIPKITFEQNDEDIFQNGCFELAKTFDTNLIKNKLALSYSGCIDYISEFSKNIYYIYKEHNALDLFYSQNCLYFGWKLYPDLIPNVICFVKRFLYMYCREEIDSKKSFYRIINDDLRSRDPHKIYRYINILALINDIIEDHLLASYEGNVYRATKLDEDLIKKLVPGINMVNTTFWSTSKDYNIADKFMKKNDWRNSFIICKTVKNNIDIEVEKLNPYNEKEVLFLPFTEFRVEKISSKIKYGKSIFTIELTDLGNRNFVRSENMQVENVKSLGLKKQLEKSDEVKEINNILK